MSNDQLFTMINSRMDRMEKKIDALISFKWKMTGAITVIASCLTFAANKLIK